MALRSPSPVHQGIWRSDAERPRQPQDGMGERRQCACLKAELVVPLMVPNIVWATCSSDCAMLELIDQATARNARISIPRSCALRSAGNFALLPASPLARHALAWHKMDRKPRGPVARLTMSGCSVVRGVRKRHGNTITRAPTALSTRGRGDTCEQRPPSLYRCFVARANTAKRGSLTAPTTNALLEARPADSRIPTIDDHRHPNADKRAMGTQ